MWYWFSTYHIMSLLSIMLMCSVWTEWWGGGKISLGQREIIPCSLDPAKPSFPGMVWTSGPRYFRRANICLWSMSVYIIWCADGGKFSPRRTYSGLPLQRPLWKLFSSNISDKSTIWLINEQIVYRIAGRRVRVWERERMILLILPDLPNQTSV